MTQDNVNSPSHYSKWPVEPIIFIMHNSMEFWRGNVIKYVSRAGSKKYPKLNKAQSEIEDLKKAIRYCEMRINVLEGKEPNECISK